MTGDKAALAKPLLSIARCVVALLTAGLICLLIADASKPFQKQSAGAGEVRLSADRGCFSGEAVN
jgi:hypothetical protein